jgi:hypothetical protein
VGDVQESKCSERFTPGFHLGVAAEVEFGGAFGGVGLARGVGEGSWVEIDA